jgi:hypothetical protein
MGVWLLIAVVAASLAAIADDRLQVALEEERLSFIRAEKRASIYEQVRFRLQPGVGGLPPSYELTLYGPPIRGFLIPIYPPALGTKDPAIFKVGTGASGLAWGRDKAVVIAGDPVWDATTGLEEYQSAAYRAYSVVAAAIVRNREHVKIGVLAALGRTDDGTFDPSGRDPSGIERLQAVARQLGWIVEAAIPWMLPEDG